jgi:hypothetical protein
MNQITEGVDRDMTTGGPGDFAQRFARLLPVGASPLVSSRVGHPVRPGRALAVVGGSVGVVAGAAQATVGSRIPEWSGAKATRSHWDSWRSCCHRQWSPPPRRSRGRSPPPVAIATGLVAAGTIPFAVVGWTALVPLLPPLVATALALPARWWPRSVLRS